MKDWKPNYYAFFNSEEARWLIGKEVMFSDTNEFSTTGILYNIDKDSETPFESSDCNWRFIRTINRKPPGERDY